MGYTTKFKGFVTIDPPLNVQEIKFLNDFSNTRRMERNNGPYFVEGTGFMGQGDDADVVNSNCPPEGQPGLWCQWIPSKNGTRLKWDGSEKFYDAKEWMTYIVDHFLRPDAHALGKVEGLSCNHSVSGVIHASGEDRTDRWTLVVKDNQVSQLDGHQIVDLEAKEEASPFSP